MIIVFGDAKKSVWARGVMLRRGYETEWVYYNPILFDREAVIDLTNEQIKIGDGRTRWLDLPAATPEDALKLLLQARPMDEESHATPRNEDDGSTEDHA